MFPERKFMIDVSVGAIRGVLQKGYSDFPQVFNNIAILKNFTQFIKKHLPWSLIFGKIVDTSMRLC